MLIFCLCYSVWELAQYNVVILNLYSKVGERYPYETVGGSGDLAVAAAACLVLQYWLMEKISFGENPPFVLSPATATW